MNTDNINVQTNPYNHGYYCFFDINGQQYYADLAYIKYLGVTECMIFKSENDQVTDWGELYCARNIEFSEKSLLHCVEEFIDQETK